MLQPPRGRAEGPHSPWGASGQPRKHKAACSPGDSGGEPDAGTPEVPSGAGGAHWPLVMASPVPWALPGQLEAAPTSWVDQDPLASPRNAPEISEPAGLTAPP